MKFEMGEIYMTAGIARRVKEQPDFLVFVNKSMDRYKAGDWGDTCKDDAKSNNEALKNEERIFAVYKQDDVVVWIITEWDRSYTTVLFPSEY